jgi:predicted kinase
VAELIVFTGVQGAGKSTFYQRHFAETHALVSKDLLRSSPTRQVRQERLIDEALRQGLSVVVDNTNPTREDRAALIAIGRRHGATVVGYFFEVELREALGRNRRREGKARVPDVGVIATWKRLAPPDPGEGFDALYRVRLRPEGDYDVAAIGAAPGAPSAEGSGAAGR